MVKASMTLPNGTIVTIEGTSEEVQSLISFYNPEGKTKEKKLNLSDKYGVIPHKESIISKKHKPDESDLEKIINLTKTCEEADHIEEYILDKQNEANRVLIPLYIVHELLDSSFGLTTTEISKVTKGLGTKVSRQNALRALKFSANSYVIKEGNPPRYVLNRRGVSYIKAIISGNDAGDNPNNTETTYLTPKKKKRKARSKGSKKSPKMLILTLKENGFFAEKKSISDVQRKLEEMGHHYGQSSLSSPLLSLVRGNQLKRVKDNDLWYYLSD